MKKMKLITIVTLIGVCLSTISISTMASGKKKNKRKKNKTEMIKKEVENKSEKQEENKNEIKESKNEIIDNKKELNKNEIKENKNEIIEKEESNENEIKESKNEIIDNEKEDVKGNEVIEQLKKQIDEKIEEPLPEEKIDKIDRNIDINKENIFEIKNKSFSKLKIPNYYDEEDLKKIKEEVYNFIIFYIRNIKLYYNKTKNSFAQYDNIYGKFLNKAKEIFNSKIKSLYVSMDKFVLQQKKLIEDIDTKIDEIEKYINEYKNKKLLNDKEKEYIFVIEYLIKKQNETKGDLAKWNEDIKKFMESLQNNKELNKNEIKESKNEIMDNKKELNKNEIKESKNETIDNEKELNKNEIKESKNEIIDNKELNKNEIKESKNEIIDNKKELNKNEIMDNKELNKNEIKENKNEIIDNKELNKNEIKESKNEIIDNKKELNKNEIKESKNEIMDNKKEDVKGNEGVEQSQQRVDEKIAKIVENINKIAPDIIKYKNKAVSGLRIPTYYNEKNLEYVKEKFYNFIIYYEKSAKLYCNKIKDNFDQYKNIWRDLSPQQKKLLKNQKDLFYEVFNQCILNLDVLINAVEDKVEEIKKYVKRYKNKKSLNKTEDRYMDYIFGSIKNQNQTKVEFVKGKEYLEKIMESFQKIEELNENEINMKNSDMDEVERSKKEFDDELKKIYSNIKKDIDKNMEIIRNSAAKINIINENLGNFALKFFDESIDLLISLRSPDFFDFSELKKFKQTFFESMLVLIKNIEIYSETMEKYKNEYGRIKKYIQKEQKNIYFENMNLNLKELEELKVRLENNVKDVKEYIDDYRVYLLDDEGEQETSGNISGNENNEKNEKIEEEKYISILEYMLNKEKEILNKISTLYKEIENYIPKEKKL